jgi:hypothetical protein
MFAKFLGTLPFLLPLIASAQERPAFGPPGYELPQHATPENLDDLLGSMVTNKCHTPDCSSLRIAIVEVLDNQNRRKPHPDIPYGAIKAKEIDDGLRPFKPIWPEICRAVVEIGARDDFVHGNETYSWLATAALDEARHLTRPGLDCLGQALAAMPESKFKQGSMAGAWNYCLDEDRGAARCARLRPTDPDFLPAPPMHLPP